MSFIDSNIKCELDGKKIETFPLFTPCGFILCAEHLISDSNSKDISYYERLISDSDLIECCFCDNHQFSLKDCFLLPKNRNFLKERIFRIKRDELAQKIKEYTLIENQSEQFISESYKEIVRQIYLRREIIKQEIENYYTAMLQEVNKLKQKAEEYLKKKLEKFNLKQKEKELNKLEEDLIKEQTNTNFKQNSFESKIQDIQDMLNKFNDLDNFIKITKDNKLKSNNSVYEIRNVFGFLEVNQQILDNVQREHRELQRDKTPSVNKIIHKRESRSLDTREKLESRNRKTQDFIFKKNFECQKSIHAHSSIINNIVVFPTGQIVSCSDDTTIKVWDKNTGECLKIYEHKSSVTCLLLLKTGELVSGSCDRNIKIWDIMKDKCLKTIEIDSEVYSLEELRLGEIASGFRNGKIKFWNIVNNKCTRTLQGHYKTVWCLKFLKTLNLVASCSSDRTIKIWRLETGTIFKTLTGHTANINCIKEFESYLVSCSDDSSIKFWNMMTWKCVKTLNGDDLGLQYLEVLENGELLSCSGDGTVQFWNKNENECKKTLKAHSNWISCLKVLSSGEVITCSWDQTIKIWSTKK